MTLSAKPASSRSTGIMLVVLSAIVFSTAGLFTKGVNAGAWDVIFWRALFAALLTTLAIMASGNTSREFANMGRSGLAVAAVGAMGSAAFIPAFKLTSIANVALIYAASPVVAGLMAWLWIGDRLSRRVLYGCIGTFSGMLILVGGSVNTINWRGDLLALWMTIALAGIMVIYRRHPETPTAGPAVLMSLILLPFSDIFGNPPSIPVQEIAILAAFGIVFSVAAVCLAEGARRLPASETALLSILEAPFAPVLAWLVLNEIPTTATWIGGALILVAVVFTQITPQTATRPKKG